MRRIACAILALCMGLSLCGCTKKAPERMTQNYLEFFDTVSQIIGYEADAEVFEENCAAVYELLSEYHQLTDIYHSYEGVNNVKTINDAAGKNPVEVDEKLIDLLSFAKDMYGETEGKCNIAMGSVFAIWHRHREIGIGDPESATVPDMETLSEAAEHCSIDDLIIDREARTVFLRDSEMSLDLGAVAKGYAVERAAELLKSRGAQSGYTVNIGGNVRTIGTKGDGGDWKAGIQNPDTESDLPYVVRVNLNDMALVTSGNYQRYYEVDGVRYHHIIDPDTLMPARYFASVSVLTSDSGKADALSTALYNMPYESGKAFVDSMEGVEAYWIFHDGEMKYTEGFKNYLTE